MRWAILAAAAMTAAPLGAAEEETARHCFGEPTPLEAVRLSAGATLDAGWFLKTGTFYETRLLSDGSAPIRLEGPEFLAAMLPAEVIVDGELMPVGPFGLPSLDFSGAREVVLGFIPTAPGVYRLSDGRGAVVVVVE
jgi:hypothetical protein